MVYEIYYEPLGNIWRIRLTVYYFYFIAVSRTVSEAVKLEGPTAEFKPMNFATCAAAEAHADRIGLTTAYIRRCRGGSVSSWVNGVGAHAATA